MKNEQTKYSYIEPAPNRLNGGCLYRLPDGELIATVIDSFHTPDMNRLVHQVNTQPELLEALKEAHRILELWEITSAAEITGAAIANAEFVK